MDMETLLQVVTFLPFAGAILMLLVPGSLEKMIKYLALSVTLLTFGASILLFLNFDGSQATIQFETIKEWIPRIGASYHIGMDGISLLLYILTTFLMPLAILASWTSINKRIKEYMIAMLILETAMLGVFISFDLLLFYLFWETMLIPMYLIIGVWGGKRRIYAAVKFVIYTMVGSVFMLVAIVYIYIVNHTYTGVYSFDLLTLTKLNFPMDIQIWLFLAFALAFAIKVPIFPFHTWLPAAHVEAPTAGSFLLAGVLLKMGTYGFLRYNLTLFPQAAIYFTPAMFTLAVIGILYGAWVAMVQKDIKKLVAYSSVSHLGFIMLGMFAMTVTSIQGGLIQMINHGISSGALFLAVGMIYERRHTREIDEFGGITKVMPVFAIFFLIICLSSLGLPGTNGFVGEFLILVGSFKVAPVATIWATVGIIFAAVYLLWMFRRVMFGPITKEENKSLTDLNMREIAIMLPLIILIFWIGIYPSTFMTKSEATVTALVNKINQAKTEIVLDNKPASFQKTNTVGVIKQVNKEKLSID